MGGTSSVGEALGAGPGSNDSGSGSSDNNGASASDSNEHTNEHPSNEGMPDPDSNSSSGAGPRSDSAMPSDDGSGPVGPRSDSAMPADDGSDKGGPRSDSAMPADDGTGPVGPQSDVAHLNAHDFGSILRQGATAEIGTSLQGMHNHGQEAGIIIVGGAPAQTSALSTLGSSFWDEAAHATDHGAGMTSATAIGNLQASVMTPAAGGMFADTSHNALFNDHALTDTNAALHDFSASAAHLDHSAVLDHGAMDLHGANLSLQFHM